MKLDISSGTQDAWYAPLHHYCEEVVIVPKIKSGVDRATVDAADDDEDDVWVLATIFNSVDNFSYIAILDGKDIGKGPVAQINLRHHLPHSLHGSFTRDVFA